MKKINIIAVAVGAIALIGSLPSVAQGSLQASFTTTFSFYAGGAKLPAGAYVIRQFQDEQNVFEIQNKAGTHSAMVEGRQSTKTSGKSEVLFNRYGTSDYLEGVESSTGSSFDLDTGIAEKVAAKKGAPQSHTVPAK